MTNIPAALRKFHLPSDEMAVYASGQLTVQGLASAFASGIPVQTVVRTKRRKTSDEDKVAWVRSFQGKAFLSSEWRYSDMNRKLQDGPAHLLGHTAWKTAGSRRIPASDTPDVHDVETVAGFDFTFRWETLHDGTVFPRHILTHTAFGLSVPHALIGIKLFMKPHADDMGWDLHMDTRVLGISVVGYTGSMRIREDVQFCEGFHDLVLFDGHCSLCSATVDFLMRYDKHERFVFCSQQHPAARIAVERAGHAEAVAILEGVGSATDRDSVLVLGADGVLYHHSDAALRALRVLGGPLGWAATLASFLPPRARDALYNLVGRNRYKWFRKKDTCRMPTPAERRRFL